MAATNLFSRAAKFRKTPAGKNMTQAEAVQHLSKGKSKVSGKKKTATKRKKVAVSGKRVGKKNTAPRNEFIVINEKSSGKRKSAAKGTVTERAIKIQSRIDKLEKQRSAQSSKQVKDVFSLAINKEHQNLRDLQKSLRR